MEDPHVIWEFEAGVSTEDGDRLQSALPKVPKVLCEILVRRGITDYEKAKKFFRPDLKRDLHDPFLMRGMQTAIERIQKAISTEESVFIYSDYDVDGTTSAAILWDFFNPKFAKTECYIPDRFREGYGLSRQGVEKAHEQKASLIIVADCGIREVDNIAYASSLGIDIIVCDHHLPGERIPVAVAVLDPKQKNCAYPYKELSGCGVVLKLIQAFCQKENLPDKHWGNYLDLAVTSIAADIVPITGENRALSFFGLKKWNIKPSVPLGIFKETRKAHSIGIYDIVFGISPMINAAGRIAHAKEAFHFLTAKQPSEAKLYYKKLSEYNQNRRKTQTEIFNASLSQIEGDPTFETSSATVVFGKWNKGVVGIVASKLIDKFYRPTLVLSEEDGFYTGSGRSVSDYDLHKALTVHASFLEKFGGHQMAVGLKIKKENLQPFIEKFKQHVEKTLPAEQRKTKISIDGVLKLKDITARFCRILPQLSPFGPKNMTPIFKAQEVYLKRNSLKIIGKDHSHLKCSVYQKNDHRAFEAIAFGMADCEEKLTEPFPFDMLFSIDQEYYRGEPRLQLRIRDFRFQIFEEATASEVIS